MKAMILAAGFGTRLRPLTNTLPKPLLQVGGKPLIVWNLLLLKAHGIRQVIINLHYLGPLIQEALGNGAKWGMDITYSHEPDILGTGGGLRKALGFFEGQPFLVINGDTLIDLDVQALVNFHREKQGVATLVLRDDPESERWGVVECDRQDRLLRINGKGVRELQQNQTIARRMFAGVHILDPALLQPEPEGISFSVIETYIKALAKGFCLFGYLHAGYWSDVGTVERYTQAQEDAESENFLVALRNQSGYT